MTNTTTSQARIDQSINIPDYFSCHNCVGSSNYAVCERLRAEGNCAKQMLRAALEAGRVRVVLHLERGMID